MLPLLTDALRFAVEGAAVHRSVNCLGLCDVLLCIVAGSRGGWVGGRAGGCIGLRRAGPDPAGTLLCMLGSGSCPVLLLPITGALWAAKRAVLVQLLMAWLDSSKAV